MVRFTLYTLGVLLIPSVLCCTGGPQKYVAIPQFVEPSFCVPSGYFQAQDLGNTNPSDLVTRCEAQCTAYGSACFSYVGELWKGADSNLYSGQCFYYAASSK